MNACTCFTGSAIVRRVPWAQTRESRTRTGGERTAPKITRERVRARFLIIWAEQLLLRMYTSCVRGAGSGACLRYTYQVRTYFSSVRKTYTCALSVIALIIIGMAQPYPIRHWYGNSHVSHPASAAPVYIIIMVNYRFVYGPLSKGR